ncbi:Uncharacterized protein GBIM_02723 [Gryllus bimaculatus]|nr:Uncharacterized protein GBIM_02723 [Gryllus bimaculatus]
MLGGRLPSRGRRLPPQPRGRHKDVVGSGQGKGGRLGRRKAGKEGGGLPQQHAAIASAPTAAPSDSSVPLREPSSAIRRPGSSIRRHRARTPRDHQNTRRPAAEPQCAATAAVASDSAPSRLPRALAPSPSSPRPPRMLCCETCMRLPAEDFAIALSACDVSEADCLVDWESVIFDSCPDCEKENMSSIPQGAFAARKVHSNMEKMKSDMENPPAKYNGKLMNSIWGLYNRYSVHNMKKITDANNVKAGKNVFSQI